MRLIGNVEKDAQVRAVASGALPSGDAVIVNSDGTVSVVAGSDAATGTAADTGFAGYGGLVVSGLPTTSKFVGFAQADTGNSDYGTAIIGTVSGSSISFGTKVSTSIATYEAPMVLGMTATTFVLIYKDYGASNVGRARVGTVSGSSISFGSVVTFEGGQTNLNVVNSATRLTDTKFVIAFEDISDSSKAKAIVGTVSGTSVSFGSAATFATPNSSKYATVSALSETKIVIAWSSTPDSEAGKAVVGTVSGTSISFGSAVTYDSSSVIRHSIVALSDTKFVIAYQDDKSGTQYGTSIAGTVSGTSITLGTPVVFLSSSLHNSFPDITNIDADNFAIVYRDTDNKGGVIQGTTSGTSITFGDEVQFSASTSTENWTTLVGSQVTIGYDQTNFTAITYSPPSTNLTSENFIGFAAHTYADTQSALVNSTCTVDRNQTSLTAGQTYYVQTDGALGTTAGDPSVVAGTAISSTEIIVKG